MKPTPVLLVSGHGLDTYEETGIKNSVFDEKAGTL
jgi:hypothetical protein